MKTRPSRRLRRLLAAVLVSAAALLVQPAQAQTDPRLQATVLRSPDGDILRSARVLREFRALWPCPATGLHEGACPGWAIDHVIPLSCGGIDAVINLQWLPAAIKSTAGEWSKDRWERRVYGGNAMSKGCP